MSTILAAVDLTRPWHAISPTVVGDTLVELSRAEEPLSGRALARRAGRAHAGVARVLDDLAEAGLVRVTPAGATSLHELNEHHVLAEAVRTMAGAREELFGRLRAAAATWSRPALTVTVYGSTIVGGGDTGSDIDVLVVTDDDESLDDVWTRQLGELGTDIESWTGNRAEIVLFRPHELEALRREQSPFLDALLEGRPVSGEPVRNLLSPPRGS